MNFLTPAKFKFLTQSFFLQIIDEIKKENFGLKLKIVFMEERLKKLGPEHNEEAIKEVR